MKTPFELFLDRINKLDLSAKDWDAVADAGVELSSDSRKEIYARWDDHTKALRRGK